MIDRTTRPFSDTVRERIERDPEFREIMKEDAEQTQTTVALRREWREVNTVTDWEFAAIGALLCDYTARDLALMVVRLQGRLGAEKNSA